MKVTLLVEDSAREGFSAAHGLSLFIEHGGKNYLLDAGAGKEFAENAEKLGVDLASVDVAFLSHAHYDHSDGFPRFFELNNHAPLYLQHACEKNNCYAIHDGEQIQAGFTPELLSKYNERLRFVEGFKDLGNGVYICPHTKAGLAKRGKECDLYLKEDDEFTPDYFPHEQSVVFVDDDKLYVFNSCSHGGVDVIIEEVLELFPGKEIAAYFGGFHLITVDGIDTCAYSKDQVEAFAKRIMAATDAIFYSGHCTGTIAEKWLQESMGERFRKISAGDVRFP